MALYRKTINAKIVLISKSILNDINMCVCLTACYVLCIEILNLLAREAFFKWSNSTPGGTRTHGL